MANENGNDGKTDTQQRQAPPPPAPKNRKVPEFQLERLKQVEFVANRFIAMIPHGTVPADLKLDSYWANVSHQLRRHDLIDCIWEDGWGEVRGVRVLVAGHAWAKVHFNEELDVREYPAIDAKRIPGYRVEYVNNFAKWSVIREVDKRVLKDQCDTEREAHVWLGEHLKAQAA